MNKQKTACLVDSFYESCYTIIKMKTLTFFLEKLKSKGRQDEAVKFELRVGEQHSKNNEGDENCVKEKLFSLRGKWIL